MKKIAIILFLATLALGLVISNLMSFGRTTSSLLNIKVNNSLKGSGKTASESRDLSGFHALNISGGIQVDVAAGREFKVEVEADDNLLQAIKTEVDGGVLRIHTEGKISTSNSMKVRISAPNIDDVDASGAITMNMSNIKNENLSIESSGGSKITVSGETENLRAELNGATKLDAEGLITRDADIEANGACKANVNVSQRLRADASGASQITYAGSPSQVEKSTNGASSVSAK
jgi:hypothetical protein